MSNSGLLAWPTGSTNTGWGSAPENNLPGMVTGWPSGSQRAASNPAEQLLTQAVAYWDAKDYRDGDRFLRNRGVAGDLLDLRLGSSVVPNTNDPLFLKPEDVGYVYLPGVNGNYLSVPDEAALDITGDLTLVFYGTADDWTPSGATTLLGKWLTTGNQRSYRLDLLTTGRFSLLWSTDGTTFITADSTEAPTIADGSALWIKATLDVDNGAGTPQYEVKFYTSPDGSTWTQLGSTVTGSTGVTSIYSSSAQPVVGISAVGGSQPFTGKVYAAQVWDGIEGSGGTKVLDIDCDAITSGSQTSFTAVTSQTVTINRSTFGRKSVAVPSRGNRGGEVFLFGTDDRLEVVGRWQHQLLNLRRHDSLTVIMVIRVFESPGGFVALYYKSSYLGGANNTGYWLRTGAATPNLYVIFEDPFLSLAVTSFNNNTFSHQLGQISSVGFVVDRTRNIMNPISGTLLTNNRLSLANLRSLENPQPVQILANVHGEFIATAVFRRALSPAEIKTISDYFTARIA